jgi:hypothetical protein
MEQFDYHLSKDLIELYQKLVKEDLEIQKELIQLKIENERLSTLNLNNK